MDKNIEQIIKNTENQNELEELQAEINEVCEQHKQNLAIKENAKEFAELPFGAIKNCFESISDSLFESSGRKYLKKYVSCVRGNQDLAKMHLFYECIRKAGKNEFTKEFINEALSMVGDFNKANYKLGCDELGKILSEVYTKYNNLFESIDTYKRDEFDEAAEYLAFNKKTLRNLAECNQRISIIAEQIDKQELNEYSKSINNIDESAESLIKNFNDKYSSNIEDISLVKEITEAEDKSLVFNKYQEKCIQKITEAKKNFDASGDQESSDTISIILEKVSNKKFNPDTVGMDICKFTELINCVD